MWQRQEVQTMLRRAVEQRARFVVADAGHGAVVGRTASISGRVMAIGAHVLVVWGLVASPLVMAQSGPPTPGPANAERALDEAVAHKLLERARQLIDANELGDAKTLIIEALERSPSGLHSPRALRMLRYVNGALGIDDPEHGIPKKRTTRPGELIDPYAVGDVDESLEYEILDPYDVRAGGKRTQPAETSDSETSPDASAPEGDDASTKPPPSRAGASRMLIGFGGLSGYVMGMALAGDANTNSRSEFSDVGITMGVLGGLAGMYAGYAIARDYRVSNTEATIGVWSGLWSGMFAALSADVLTGIDKSSVSDIFRGMFLGGVLGTAIGSAYATDRVSNGDIGMVNSGGLYGAGAGAFLALILDPLHSEAYSVNAMLGAVAGLGTGMFAARRWDTSRGRMLWIDTGVALGAATPWLVLYPAVADSDNRYQIVGAASLVSMVAGGYLAWYMTKGTDKKTARASGNETPEKPTSSSGLSLPPVPGIVQRTPSGDWRVGTLSLRPLVAPTDSRSRRPGRGVLMDIVGGRF